MSTTETEKLKAGDWVKTLADYPKNFMPSTTNKERVRGLPKGTVFQVISTGDTYLTYQTGVNKSSIISDLLLIEKVEKMENPAVPAKPEPPKPFEYVRGGDSKTFAYVMISIYGLAAGSVVFFSLSPSIRVMNMTPDFLSDPLVRQASVYATVAAIASTTFAFIYYAVLKPAARGGRELISFAGQLRENRRRRRQEEDENVARKAEAMNKSYDESQAAAKRIEMEALAGIVKAAISPLVESLPKTHEEKTKYISMVFDGNFMVGDKVKVIEGSTGFSVNNKHLENGQEHVIKKVTRINNLIQLVGQDEDSWMSPTWFKFVSRPA